jgi:hypothetical protein
VSATAEPSFTHRETDVTDQAGTTTHETRDVLSQRYRLSLSRALTDALTADVGGTLLDERGWTRAGDIWSDQHGRSTSIFGRLTLGTPVLNASVAADRTKQETLSSSAPSVVTERYTAQASWRPLGLPELELRAGRVIAYDVARRAHDSTTDSAHLGTRYAASRYDLRYLLGWSRTADRLHRAETTSIEQTVLGTRTDHLLAGRLTTYVSGTLQSRNTSVESSGAGGTVSRQQLPSAGYSTIVRPPATSVDVDLSPNPNPLLVDGNTAASASVNVGSGPGAGGDLDPREVGAGFANAVTAVNTIHVWLDRAMPPEVSGALAGSAEVYLSDDNRRWTRIDPVDAEPSPFASRIEIVIPQRAARYLKVSLRPLATGVTTDPAFRELFVTEVQFLLVLPVASVPRQQSAVVASATALARTVIVRSPAVAHDLSANVAHQSAPSLTTYNIVNGLSASHGLGPRLAANARVARLDVDAGRGHEGAWQWSAGLVGTPLPTAQWSLTYSGSENPRTGTVHALNGLGRADWYDGISTQAAAAASVSMQGLRTTRSVETSGSTSLRPNRFVTVSAGGLYSYAIRTEPDVDDIWSQFARVDGSISLTPAPSLSAAATVSRVLIAERPTTLATLRAGFSPLRGDLQLSIGYSKTLDTGAEATTEILTPSLRWNVRRGVSLRGSYTFLEEESRVQVRTSRAVTATLLVTI